MISCPFFDNGICKQASNKAGFSVPTYKDTCKACLSGRYVLDGLITVEKHKRGEGTAVVAGGPGTELQKIISWLPVPKKKNCSSCLRMVARMNKWGPDVCLTKMPYILKKLEIAAARRNVPFSKSLAEKLVIKAINSARKK